jgi:hypothetical protein
MNAKTALFLGLASITWASAPAGFGIGKDGRLDMPAIRKAYQESEFEKAGAFLEKFLKDRTRAASREDSIFAFKYLGVIYAADSLGQTRSESYFNRLLTISPHIELVDMYVSSRIQAKFDEVKREFRRQADYRSRFDALGNPLPAGSGEGHATGSGTPATGAGPEVSDGKSRAWIFWTAALAAVGVGSGVGIYLWSESLDGPKSTDVDGGL